MLKKIAWKDRRLPILTIGFQSERGQDWSVKYVRGYEWSSICLLSTILPLAANPSSGRAAGRSPFLSSVQFKENACHGHVPIYSYGFASRRYLILVHITHPADLRFHFLQIWRLKWRLTFDGRYNIAHLTILWIFYYDKHYSFYLNLIKMHEKIWVNTFYELY